MGNVAWRGYNVSSVRQAPRNAAMASRWRLSSTLGEDMSPLHLSTLCLPEPAKRTTLEQNLIESATLADSGFVLYDMWISRGSEPQNAESGQSLGRKSCQIDSTTRNLSSIDFPLRARTKIRGFPIRLIRKENRNRTNHPFRTVFDLFTQSIVSFNTQLARYCSCESIPFAI